MLSNVSGLSTNVKAYLEAREQIHEKISKEPRSQASAQQHGDLVTLTKDVQVGDKLFRAGSAYHLNPYLEREAFFENLAYSSGPATVVISHEFKPGLFKTEESLKVDTRESSAGSSVGIRDFTKGIRPNGWLQRQVQQLDGYILPDFF